MKWDKDSLQAQLEQVIQVLENEDPATRPQDSQGKPGGLVLLREGRLTYLVPDLHGRKKFLPLLLERKVGGKSLESLLEADQAQIICVGDGMHAEIRAATRWREALAEFEQGFETCPAMDEEMEENFATMAQVMELKTRFPNNFHFLKGNHENILDETAHGNHPFAKFAREGIMSRVYVEKFLGSDFLLRYAHFEKQLPLMARGSWYIVTHARPKRSYSLQEVLNYRLYPEVIEGLTWTRNHLAATGAVFGPFKEILGSHLDYPLWFCGHTPVTGLYKLIEPEHLILFHNPNAKVVVELDPKATFNPDRHIFLLE